MKFLNWLMVTLVTMVLAACGGGGSSLYGTTTTTTSTSGSSSATTTVTPTATLTLSNKVLSANGPVTATATVTTGGTPLSGVTVSFKQGAGTVAVLSSSAVATDTSGNASVTLTSASSTTVGDDTLTASVTVSGAAGSASTPFTVNSASVIELLSSNNVASTSGDEVTVTAIVKSDGGVGIKGAPVTFTTDTGTLKLPSSVTDDTGVASVKFTAGTNKANRAATIKVTSGFTSSAITLAVAGSKLSVSGATTVSLAGTTTLTVKATDNTGNTIPNAVVTVSSALGNPLSKPSLTTDLNGQATVNYTATSAGSDTVTFKGLGVSATTVIAISSVDFSFVQPLPNVQVPVGAAQTLQVQYRQNLVGVAGQTVNFASTGGALSSSSAVTDANGIAQVTIQSASAAPATVQATLASGGAQATLPLSFIATTPNRLVLQTSPTAIGPNTDGSTTNQAQVLAKVSDANGNPVPNIVVNFSRDVDPSGGNLMQGTATTDMNGQATVQYVAGAQSTRTDGILLRGRVASSAAVTGTAGLTVNQSPLFIALGRGNTISNLDPQTYKKDWTVYVTDSQGVAVSNVSITARILPTQYRKGRLTWDGVVWGATEWDGVTGAVADPSAAGKFLIPVGKFLSCANEDSFYGDNDSRSFNGRLDTDVSGTTEDLNGNGTLEPGNVIALTPDALNLKTDSKGRATLSLVYAESYVPWVKVALQVQAIVSGTASTTSSVFVVEGLSSDFVDSASTPAGRESPFGYRTSCADPK